MTKVAGDQIQEVTLRPDNKVVKPLVVTADDEEMRVVAEYLETVG